MKVLIVPDIDPEKSNFLFTYRLIHLLEEKGHICIVSAPKKFSFSCTSYDAPTPRYKMFVEIGKSYEEWLFNSGRISLKYLRKDILSLSNCVSIEKPDLILDLGRISAQIIGRIHNIPYYSFVSSICYREKTFNKDVLSQLNTVLSENGLEQILYIYDLYSYASKRISFSSSSVQLFQESNNVERYEIPLPIEIISKSPSVSLFFLHTDKDEIKLKRLIIETFLNAPYKVEAYIPDIDEDVSKNIHFLEEPKLDSLSSNNVVIHDGEFYLYHACITLGIPQIIINTGTPEAVYESSVTRRYGFGTTINEYELSVASIYEAYRRVSSNDGYKKRAELARNEANKFHPLDDLF